MILIRKKRIFCLFLFLINEVVCLSGVICFRILEI